MDIDAKDRSLVTCDESDSDEFSPDFEEAEMLVDLLLEANPRERFRGMKGKAIRELHEIRARLSQWEKFTPQEKTHLVVRLWEINNGLAAGRSGWRPKKRLKGENSKTIDHGRDDEMIHAALALEAKEGSLGAALRKVVEAQAPWPVDVRSVVQRLRRKIEKGRLQPS